MTNEQINLGFEVKNFQNLNENGKNSNFHENRMRNKNYKKATLPRDYQPFKAYPDKFNKADSNVYEEYKSKKQPPQELYSKQFDTPDFSYQAYRPQK